MPATGIQIVSLHIYPVKSCGAINVNEALVTKRGLKAGNVNDRRWMLVDKNNVHITQRERERRKLARVKVGLVPGVPGQVMISAEEMDWKAALTPDDVSNEAITALMHPNSKGEREKVPVHVMNGPASQWFQEFLGDSEIRLVYQTDDDIRHCDNRFANNPSIDTMSLGDGYPLLLTSVPTLRQAEDGLGKLKPMNRFRPNVVIDGDLGPNEENTFASAQYGTVLMAGVKPCTRCIITGIDQKTGIYEGPEVIQELKRTSKVNYKHGDARVVGVVFGENLIPMGTGTLRVGDKVTVTGTKSAPQFLAT